jgi:hypothetical protein
MTNIRVEGDTSLVKYTIKLNTLADMAGFVVEIVDKYNSKDYTLDKVYREKDIAIIDANTFINDLFEEEISMLIN